MDQLDQLWSTWHFFTMFHRIFATAKAPRVQLRFTCFTMAQPRGHLLGKWLQLWQSSCVTHHCAEREQLLLAVAGPLGEIWNCQKTPWKMPCPWKNRSLIHVKWQFVMIYCEISWHVFFLDHERMSPMNDKFANVIVSHSGALSGQSW